MTNEEKVIDYLDRRSAVASNGCIVWRGPLLNSGYGAANVAGMKTTAHRVALSAWSERDLSGLQCRNRLCINPLHLEAVTQRQNMQRTPSAMATRCKHGHDLTVETTYIKANGCRSCRRCNARRQSELRKANVKEQNR
jgi:hypothetical protein